MITILAIGKKHEPWIKDGLERYEKRLKKPYDVQWILLPHSSREGQEARETESEALLGRVKADDFVVLLDEAGKLLASPALSHLFEEQFTTSRNTVLVIGGAYGVSAAMTQRAQLVWSLSPLVFPHQLVRLLLIEQIYRSQQIALGSSYHHE